MVTGYDNKTDLNIVILNEHEEIIKWLNSDLCGIKETCEINKPRQIEIEYPLRFEELNLEGDTWYSPGNKIYIPATLGINSCLYVINTDYDLDYWKKNTVKFTAEEVITELNYELVGFITTVTQVTNDDDNTDDNSVIEESEEDKNLVSGTMIDKTVQDESGFRGTQIFKYKDKIEVTSEVLRQFFGYFYEIGGVDSLDSQKKYISPRGTMTYMSLLRLIEEQTERVFITEYINIGNKITRRLNLRNYQNMRRVAQTELLDLNYNLDSLELNVSEEKTYTAMAPEFTDNSTVVNADTSQTTIETGAEIVNTAQNASTTNTTSNSKTISEIIQDWLDYEVEPRQEHPMIVQKDTAGNLVSVASWYAPFRKMKGSLSITSERQTESNYNTIISQDKKTTLYKTGKVSTSESHPEIIYNTLANELLNKLSPVYDLKVDVKDIQELMGIPNLSYELYETLQVRIPNFDYYVPCRITGTVKNPHKPGENKITVETDVKSIRNLHETEIISSDMIVNEDNPVNLGGLLQSEEVGLNNRLVTVNIKLLQAFNDGTIGVINNNASQQVAEEFDPLNNTYIFDEDEMYKARLYLYSYADHKKESFNLRTVTGQIVKIPHMYMVLIVFTRFQNWETERVYTATDNKPYYNTPSLQGTTTIHLYDKSVIDEELAPEYFLLNFVGKPAERIKHFQKYAYSAMYYKAEELSTLAKKEDSSLTWDYSAVTATLRQDGGTCAPVSLANSFIYSFELYHPSIIGKNLGTDYNTGTYFDKIHNISDPLENALVTPVLNTKIFDRQKYVSYRRVDAFGSMTFDDLTKDVTDLLPSGAKRVAITHIFHVDTTRLKTKEYYDGVYSLVSGGGGHVVTVIAWKIVNNIKYVFVIDPNLPIFATDYYTQFDVLKGWVKWSVLQGANNLGGYFEGGVLKNYITDYGKGMGIKHTYYYTGTPVLDEASVTDTTDVYLPVQKVEITPLDLSNNIYLFKSSIVQKAINTVYEYYIEQGMKHDINTITTQISDVTGQRYNLKMKELMGLAYSYVYYYQNNTNKTSSNIDLRYGKNEDSQKYIDHMGGEYDYFTPVYPQQKGYENQYILSACLFHLGVLSSPLDFFQNRTEQIKFNDMIIEINKKTSEITCFTREFNETILKSVLHKQDHSKFMNNIIVVYAFNESLVSKSQYISNCYPLLLYTLDDENNIGFYNLAGRGNSVGFNYNTKKSDYTANPYGTVNFNTLLEWIDNAKDYHLNGKNCLILSRYLTIGSI